MCISVRKEKKMLKLKSAQTDFLDKRVTYILRLIGNEQYKCQQKLQTIEELHSMFDDLKVQDDLTMQEGGLNIGVQDLQRNAKLWEKIKLVIGDLGGI